MRNARISAVGTVTLLIAVAAAAADDQHVANESRTGLVLLRNGNVIEGTITRSGDRYKVSVRDGELSVPASDVEFVGRDLDEVYRHRRGTIRSGVAEQHLMLADWCLRRGLLKYAARELNDASRAEGAHPRIAILERRLKLANRPPDPVKRDPPPSQHPTVAELDRVVEGMPPGTTKTFSLAIQPLLLNTCATGVCHGPRSANGFRLLRPLARRAPSRRLIQRNLHSTLKWIDRDDPDASPILTTPLAPHGTSSTAIFTSRDVGQYRQLANWVNEVVNKKREVAPPRVGTQAKPLLQQMLSPFPSARLSTGDRQATARSQVQSSNTSASRPPPPRVGPWSGSFVPLDDFDPEIFNRLFGAEKKPAENAIDDAQTSKSSGE